MDTAWIEVFVLTLSECLAPAGKTVCQEQELQMQFVDQAECEFARDELVWLLDQSDNVIVNRNKTRCTASARQQIIFASQEEIRQQAETGNEWMPSGNYEPPAKDFTQEAHQKRLDNLSKCEDVGGSAPCKIGEIIIEGATEQQAEVWRKE